MNFSKFEDFLVNIYWYRFISFIKDWTYPGYSLKNFLFKRYDLIKIKSVKPYEYAEPDTIMFEANMELIRKFIEEYNPEKHICWYKDKDGVDCGHKYGEGNKKILFPEYKGMYIMDIIKKIYQWYKKELPNTFEDVMYLTDFCHKNKLDGEMKYVPVEGSVELYEIEYDYSKAPKSIDELKEVNWNILDKYFSDRNDVLDFKKVIHKSIEIENMIEEDKQHYLHLCIEVRQYLWT
jgi:hypothetical protein